MRVAAENPEVSDAERRTFVAPDPEAVSKAAPAEEPKLKRWQGGSAPQFESAETFRDDRFAS